MAAEEIKAILGGREKAEQERIIRWVTESLGLSAFPVGGSAHALPTPPSPTPQVGHHGPGSHAPAKDIKVFVDEKKPKSDMQFAAVVAYYYSFEAHGASRKVAVSAEDLQEAARLAGWQRFRSPAVPLHNAVRQGYLDRAGRGEFKLNAVGENLVAMALPGTDGDGQARRGRRQKRKQLRNRPRKLNKKPRAS